MSFPDFQPTNDTQWHSDEPHGSYDTITITGALSHLAEWALLLFIGSFCAVWYSRVPVYNSKQSTASYFATIVITKEMEGKGRDVPGSIKLWKGPFFFRIFSWTFLIVVLSSDIK